jgi:hypothetical protein
MVFIFCETAVGLTPDKIDLTGMEAVNVGRNVPYLESHYHFSNCTVAFQLFMRFVNLVKIECF